jgi:hypothetical protein
MHNAAPFDGEQVQRHRRYNSHIKHQTPTTMSTKTNLLTRDEAIAKAGIAAIEKLDNENCEATNRLMGDNSDLVEYAASVRVDIKDEQGDTYEWTLTAYYYPTTDELEAAGDDLGNVDWSIEGYQLV